MFSPRVRHPFNPCAHVGEQKAFARLRTFWISGTRCVCSCDLFFWILHREGKHLGRAANFKSNSEPCSRVCVCFARPAGVDGLNMLRMAVRKIATLNVCKTFSKLWSALYSLTWRVEHNTPMSHFHLMVPNTCLHYFNMCMMFTWWWGCTNPLSYLAHAFLLAVRRDICIFINYFLSL